MSVGVLVNPSARENLRRPNRLEEYLAGRPDVVFGRADRFEDLADILDDFMHREVRAILISGGDGTVQAVQTRLAEMLPADRLPRLAIIPDGTTNMNAADIGVQNPRSRVILERLSVAEYCVRSTNVKRRFTVRVDNPADGAPRHGMFLGLGAIHRAVVMCYRDVHTLGLAGGSANAVTLAKALFSSLVGRDRDGDPDRIYQPTPITIAADGRPHCDGDQFLALVTTLHRLVLASRPFWNQSKEALKVTSVAFPPRRLLSSLPTAMYGLGSRRWLPDAYRSTAATLLEIHTRAPVILDGETLQPPADGPMTVSLGPAFEYLCG
jgi:hypothetical protein